MNKVKHRAVWATFFALLSLLWLYPIFLVIFNSLKDRSSISLQTFTLPSQKTFVGADNYINAFEKTDFGVSFFWSVVITVGAVALMVVCTSMCAWWIVRANNWFAKIMYYLFLISMIVPFQMVMFPLSKLTDMAGLNTPWGLWLVYLGFGPGLPVFIFTGAIKSLPVEIEEAAMIDGASVIRTFFSVVIPMLKPSLISVTILQAMWVWNDYLLPFVTLDLQEYQTVPIAIQVFKGSYGTVDWGAMMSCLVMAIIPILIFYMICQKYIIAGITAGAVKG